MERMLPQNIEAEQAVLGSILIDDSSLRRVQGFLQGMHFYRDAHRSIYEAMCTLSSRQEEIDFVTICEELRKRKRLEQVGGESYLASLINCVPTAGNILYYARIVEKKGRYRALIRAATEIVQGAYDEDETIFQSAQGKVFKAVQTNSGNAIVSHREALTEYLETLDTIQQTHQDGTLPGIPTGFNRLNAILGGWRGSKLYILAARPGEGKTALALNFAHHAIKQCGCRVLMFSIEMDREELMQRFVAMEAQIDTTKLRDARLSEMDAQGYTDWDRVMDGASRLQLADGTLWIDDTPGNNIDLMRARAMQMKEEDGVDFIIVDYLQLAEGTDEDGHKAENRRLEVEKVSRGLKALAREMNVPVLALAQLNRNVEGRQVKTPQLSDLREAGGIEQDGDVVMFITKDPNTPDGAKEHDGAIIVGKNRSGEKGVIPVHYVGWQTRFYPLRTQAGE